MEKELCEACKVSQVETIDDTDDPIQPYKLCKECHHKLQNLSLRPREWYNLAVVHGPEKFYLHDDFYDENGLATCPEEDLLQPEKYPAPTLQNVKSNLEDLLNYSMTQYWLKEDIIVELSKFPSNQLLESIKKRFNRTNNPSIKIRIYSIVIEVLKTSSADWVREQWENYNKDFIISLSHATSASLLNEGYNLVIAALKDFNINKNPALVFACLYHFCSQKTLFWLEDNVDTFNENWGRLAATSHPTWSILKKWLDSGRPFSLISLDTMRKCVPHEGDLIIKKLKPRVLGVPSYEIVINTLKEYEERDQVPRVKNSVKLIIANLEKIL